ncbi:hypothetical protein SESBI_49175 [Sesbania bispinosa]|nr:hypothetical protein SESBI_49175 [Sesbania bispinosa]
MLWEETVTEFVCEVGGGGARTSKFSNLSVLYLWMWCDGVAVRHDCRCTVAWWCGRFVFMKGKDF